VAARRGSPRARPRARSFACAPR